MSIHSLIDFIDRHTNNGAIYSHKLWDKSIGIEEESIAFIHEFSGRDWLALRSLNLKEKSDLWIECLIDILDKAYTEDGRQMIIHIALTGTGENFLTAMEYIQDFRRDVDIYAWLKLKNRSSEILKNKLNR